MALARLLSRRLAIAVIALAVAAQGLWLVSSYPYPIAAYNPLLGGTTVARQAIMVGWGEGLEQAADYLNGLPSSGRLTTSTQYHHVLRLVFNGRTVRVPSSRPVDYYVVYVNMVQRNTVPTPGPTGDGEQLARLHGDGERRPVRLGLSGAVPDQLTA